MELRLEYPVMPIFKDTRKEWEIKTEGYRKAEDIIKNAPSVVPQIPSEDCISREYVKGICEFMLDEEMLGHMLGYIEEAPSVVPSRAEGEWINKHEWANGFYERECSICGAMKPQLMHTAKINYCPNCGVPMKGAGDE